MTKFIFIGILSILISCKNNKQLSNESQKNVVSSSKNRIEETQILVTNGDCDFEKYLNDPKTPKLAKELFENKAKNDDAALEYFKNLKSSDKNEREFYFKVITNLYKVADGSTSEGLGHSGLTHIENNTIDFFNFFENEKCFSEDDLKTWANISMLEFSLEYENENNINIVNDFISKINENCKNCNTSKKETLKKFSNYLTKEWENYLIRK
jgi:hypothetical protein